MSKTICSGLDHEDGTAVTAEIVFAMAKAANALDFICNLDEGYDTVVVSCGNRPVDGQCQRVASSLIVEPSYL